MTRPVEIEAGTGPARPWNTAWGKVGTPFVSTTFSQAVTSTTGIDLTGALVTFIAVPGRQYKMTVGGFIGQQSVAAGTAKTFISDAANAVLGLVQDAQLAASAFGSRATLVGTYINPASLAAGSTTWHLRSQVTAGTCTISNDSGAQCLVLVEDIGPL